MKTQSLHRSSSLFVLFLSLCFAIPSAAQEKGVPHDGGVLPGKTGEDRRKNREKDESVKARPPKTVVSAIAPLNDNFASAPAIANTGSGTVTNNGATGEPGEPAHGAGRGAQNPGQINSIWYKYIAQSPGVVVFSTSTTPTDPIGDTVVSAYTGSAVNALTPVAENDDYTNTYYGKITFGVAAGQTYYIAVDGFAAAAGNFQIQYSFQSAPPNDFSFNPEWLGSDDNSPTIGITGSNVGATGSVGEFVHHSDNTLPLNSIWYTWSPPTSGTYTFTTAGSNFDTVLAVYFAIGSQIIHADGSNDDFGPQAVFTSRVTFYAFSGMNYYIAIDGYGATVGNTLLNWYPSREESGKRFDLDGDKRSDTSIFRPSNGQWWIQNSSTNAVVAATFGTVGDKPTPADFTGDGKVDIAFWRPSDGFWYVLRSEDYSYYALPFGTTGDIPATGKFDNDDRADLAIFRPSTGTWYIRRSRTGTAVQQGFGIPGDIPVAADYDSDGVCDIAIFRPSNGQWWINRSRDGLIAMTFGASGDVPVPGAYTFQGYANVAFWRPSTGEWFVLRELGTALYYSSPFGLSTDIPAPGDYDGDGKFDMTVFRPSTGIWYRQQSSNGFVVAYPFGLPGDRPLASSYQP